jgi:hypothetical protein
MLKRRQQRIMMQKICTEDKKSAQQDLLHYFNILSFGISLEMVGGSRILFMLPF